MRVRKIQYRSWKTADPRSRQSGSADRQSAVSQVGNLQIVSGSDALLIFPCLQTASRRYSRLPVGATNAGRIVAVNPLPCAAFTLIEVMISSALMALILVSAYLCLGSGFAAQKLIEPRAEIIQNARVAMAIMSADLRAACPLSKTDDFLGMPRTVGDVEADNIDFGTHNYTPRHAREGDFCQESFYLDKNPETGQFSLFRRRNPTIALDALSGGSKEEIAQGVVGLKFSFYDGTDWFDSWGDVDTKKKAQNASRQASNLSGLPKAVQITLLMDSNPKKKKPDNVNTEEEKPEPPFVFTTVVCLNLADAVQTAETASPSSTDNSSPDQTQDNGANNNGGNKQ